MELLIFIGLLIIIILLIRQNSLVDSKLNELSKKIDGLKNEIKKLSVTEPRPSKSAEKKDESILSQILNLDNPKQEPVKITEPKIESQAKEQEPVKKQVPVLSPAKAVSSAKPKEKKPTFFERNPDIEKFIGENLINKIGIAILVLGIGFFVKYAIDQNWIHEIGRVFIGILCGGILLGLAHKMRKTFAAFSSVLIGGGMSIFYFTISIAFHEYNLFSQTAAFLIMVVITGFSVLFSITYNRKELAVLAIIGGFASPFMVSTGEGNYIILFTYIITLNTGMLVLAYFKGWKILNIISYLFTIVLYGGWLITKVKGIPDAPYTGAMVFATLFYLIFFLMNIINNIKENKKFAAIDISILLSNTFLYYTAGMIILANIKGGMFQGLFTAVIAIFNFIFAFTLYKTKKADTNLIYLLIGLVLTFLSLAAPVQLEGNYITLFWSAEAVLLLWLSQKSGITLIKVGSLAVTVLMLVSLIMDWISIYDRNFSETIILNKGFITSIIALTSLILTRLLLKKETATSIIFLPVKYYDKALGTIFLTLLYFAGFLELHYQLLNHISIGSLRAIITGSYNFMFVLSLLLLDQKDTSRVSMIRTLVLGLLSSIFYMTYYHQEIIKLREAYLIAQSTTFLSFTYQYIDTLLFTGILVLMYRKVKSVFGFKVITGKLFLWYLSFVALFILSSELDHVVLFIFYKEMQGASYIISQNHKIGYPILWGLSSLVFMVLGMKKKRKELRIISLTTFFITLLKLFIFDLRGISEGGKIASFICLGVLLLVISFMYQKLKKLIIDDETTIAS
ncbi:DUF2339 domain-containing protein [Sporocytophaga myxococcoides]|uniref:DUF2339 domain-containing protein n=1 Tax=Sporocytophaga myxococcoides TaxID=153721 RepID=UPI0003FC98E7|nr:DUF2339 domain-containing protein [Sporocytophaga myxococcoides]